MRLDKSINTRVSIAKTLIGLTLLALVTSCTGVSRVPPRRQLALRLPGGGVLYLVAGPNPYSAQLYKLSGDGRFSKLTRLPAGYGVDWVAADRRNVVVADARRGTDGIDELQLQNGTLTRIVSGEAVTPALSAGGLLAYVRLNFARQSPGQKQANVFEVVTQDLSPLGAAQVRYRSNLPLASPTFGPSGEIAFVIAKDRDDSATRIVVLRAGHTVTLITGISRPGYVLWSRSGLLAVTTGYLSAQTPITELIDPSTGKPIGSVSGWVGLAWSPDGRFLLASHGSQLGVVNSSVPNRITLLGQLTLHSGIITSAAWVGGMS